MKVRLFEIFTSVEGEGILYGTKTVTQLKYQQDIAAISGATISAKSMTNEVNKLLKTIHILYTKQLL